MRVSSGTWASWLERRRAWSVQGLGSGESGAWTAAPPPTKFQKVLGGQEGAWPLSRTVSSFFQNSHSPLLLSSGPSRIPDPGSGPSGQSQLASLTPELQSTVLSSMEKSLSETSPVVQQLRRRACSVGGTCSIPGWGTTIPHAQPAARKKALKQESPGWEDCGQEGWALSPS